MNSKAPSATPLDPVEEAIFNAASELDDSAARAAFLDRACANDAALRSRLEALLRGDQQAKQYFSDDPLNLVSRRVGAVKAALPDSRDEAVGLTIGRYKLLEKIGEGGCGVVYVAEQTEPVRRRVALKVIKLGMDTRQVVARFEAERQALAMMDHPNIAKVLEAGTTETGRPYFVMELVRGIRITDYCDQANLNTKERLDLFIRVCQAIQHAHQKGIIHRDIKPSNLLVTLHDGMPVPKVIDFGIAKATEGRLTDATVYTQLHQFIGTPAYMSPEQAEMSGLDIDTRSDIYSLGVLLYELLVGSTPFDAKELMASGIDAMRKTIREKEPTRPSTKLSQTLVAAKEVGRVTPCAPSSGETISMGGAHGVTRPTSKSEEEDGASSRRLLQIKEIISLLRGDLDWIVMKCLEKDRRRRYETANGLASDIQRHLNHEPVTAAAPNTTYRLRKFVRRNRAAVAVIFSIAALLIAGITTSGALAIWARRAERQAILAKNDEVRANARLQNQLTATERERLRADAEKLAAQRHLYAANMKLVQQAAEQNNVSRLRQLLEQTRVSPDRGFEWYYWQRQSHFALRILQGHRAEVKSVAFSPDGLRILTASLDGTAKVLNTASGQETLTFKGHTAPISAAAWFPDGQSFATGSSDHTVKIWNADTGREMASLPTDGCEAFAIAISQNARNIVAVGTDGSARIWEMPSGRKTLAMEAHIGRSRSVAFSPDGARFATAGDSRSVKDGLPRAGIGRIWDTATGRELLALEGHADTITSLAFSPDGRQVLTGSDDSTARLWDANTGQELLQFPHGWFVKSVAFSADGRQFATASADWTVRIRQAADGKELFTYNARQPVFSVAFSRDGQRIGAGCADGTVFLWELATPYAPPMFIPQTAPVLCVAFSPDSQRVVTGSLDQTKVWDTSSGRELLSIRGHSAPVVCVKFSRDGQRILTGSDGHTAQVSNAADGRQLLRLSGHTGAIRSVAFSTDGGRILTGSDDGTARLWKATDGKELLQLRGFASGVRSVAFSPDGKQVLVGSGDLAARIWDAESGKELFSLEGHTGGLFSVAFSPDGRRIVTGGSDQSPRVWDGVTGRQLQKLDGHTREVWSVAFSSDGARIVTGSADKTARVWDAHTGLELLVLHGQSDIQAAISENSRLIAVSDPLGVRIWAATSPEERDFTGAPGR